MLDQSELLNDLSFFADLGTEAPLVTPVKDGFRVTFVRDGETVEIVCNTATGEVVELAHGRKSIYRDFRAMLASSSFADLGRWADGQIVQLEKRATSENIPIFGRLSKSESTGSIDLLDQATIPGRTSSKAVLVTLVDGPAGIGKTSLLRQLAFRRALNYRAEQRPLLLHVESRGRMLQNLTDLMAFSLQTLRLRVTYDQIPVLVRHGLVTLAIDGFDELGDPSGYDLAWAQVNDLIVSSRGSGSLVLAGRETFIGEGRMKSALAALDESKDKLQTFTLLPPTVDVAKDWLNQQGWTDEVFKRPEVSAIFEEGSYALRPFFLKEISQEGVAARIGEGAIGDLLQFLVETMIDREVSKFGEDIENATTQEQRRRFLHSFLEEVSRDMADNQTDAIPGDTLSWIAEVVAADKVSSTLAGVLKNRASVVAFLTLDQRRGYRRFSDDQIGNFFLSRATFRAVAEGEVPKHVRRNILGLEFLENFCSAARTISQELVDGFCGAAIKHITDAADYDRSRRNLASLVLAVNSVREASVPLQLSDVSVDDAYMTETVGEITLRNVTIAQLFARGADLKQIRYEEHGVVVSLIADSNTVPPERFPLPSYIILPEKTLVSLEEKGDWIAKQFISGLDREPMGLDQFLSRFPMFTLLHKIARTRSYWIKEEENDKNTRRIFTDENWPELKDNLLKHGLLLVSENVGAGGRPGTFYHLRNKQALLSLDDPPEAVRSFLSDLIILSYRKAQSIKQPHH